MSTKKQQSRKAQLDLDAQRRAELILKVRNHECTATAAAAELGISRKNYYRWEKRAFQAMLEALTEGEPGRPEVPPEIIENRNLKDFIKYQEKELDKARQAELLVRRAYELKIREIEGKVEKNRAIRLLVDEAINFKIDCDVYLYKAAAIMGVRYQTLWRYKRKIESAQDPVEKRGPKTAPPVDPVHIREDIRNLKHGQKRTAGTGELHEIYHGQISRELLNELIREIRDELKRGRREHAEQIIWDCPHMIWSMDDFEYVFKGIKFYVHQIQDLASRYKFEPLIDSRPIRGEAIAENLRKLFKKYGAPLFMKRDNGSNLNHFSVIDVLQEFGVVPLNNPAYYPQFNGGIEHAQGEVKCELDIQAQQFEQPDTFPFAVKQAIHNVNHNPRPVSLKGNCSCGVWMLHMGVRFSKRYRSKVYQEIKALAIEMYQKVDYTDKELVISECWRKAVKQWLIVNEHITVIRKREV